MIKIVLQSTIQENGFENFARKIVKNLPNKTTTTLSNLFENREFRIIYKRA